VILLDTVRLVRAAGLIAEEAYRPSRSTHLYSLAAGLTRAELDLAQAVARGSQPASAVLSEGWPIEHQARGLDVAAEELRIRYNRNLVAQDVYAKRYLAILHTRSTLSMPKTASNDPASPPAPDRGHRSMRLTLGGGVEDSRSYAELGLRPAYHDELDPGLGYLPGSQIEFMNTVFRCYEGEDTPDLQRLDVIRVQSLAPRDRFFRPISWKADVGLRRESLGGPDDDALIAYGTPGAGAAWRLGRDTLIYALGEAELQAGGIDTGWALGAGASAGLYQQITPRCRLQLAGRALYFGLGDHHADSEAWIAQRWQVTTNQALTVRAALHRLRGDSEPSAGMAWHWYF